MEIKFYWFKLQDHVGQNLTPASCFTTTCMFLCVCSITYNGSMESPVPLYPTDCPPPYEAVMGQRDPTQVSVCKLASSTRDLCDLFALFTQLPEIKSLMRLSVYSPLMLASLLPREEPLWLSVVKVHAVYAVLLCIICRIGMYIPFLCLSLFQCQVTLALC